MPDALINAAGWAIVLLVSSDIFRSLVVPRSATHTLRLGPILVRTLFPLWQAIAERAPGRRQRQTVRASLAPFMLVFSLVIWASLLILGFGLVFYALRADLVPRPANLGRAIFAAGAAFSTLGGPSAVIGIPAQLAVVACAVSGLATVTVVATFLISVQGGFTRRETLVLRLEAHVTLPPAGISILETYAREKVTPRLAAFFDAWEAWAADIALSHRAFPILVFFRSNDSRCEWLAALGAVLDAAALLDTNVADAPPSSTASAHFVLRTGIRLLDDIAEELDVAPSGPAAAVGADRLTEYRARLAASGYALAQDEGAAFARFTERRMTYAPKLAALAARLLIAVEDAA